MTLEMDLTKHPDHLVFTITGTYETQPAIDKFPMVLEVCKFTGINKIMVDFRQLGGTTAAIEEMLYAMSIGDFYQQYLAGGGTPLGFAFVGTDRFVKAWNPGVAIARDHGMKVLLTTDYEQALDWLLKTCMK